MDARFVPHGGKSTGHAGVVVGALPGGGFRHEHPAHQRPRWDSGAIRLAMAATRIGALVYHRLRGRARARGELSCEFLHV